MYSDTFILKVHGVPGIDYVFKRPLDERLLTDPDLQRPYDIEFTDRCDAHELVARAFNECEAESARRFVVDHVLLKNVGDRACLVGVEMVPIDPDAPLASFEGEDKLLRILNQHELRESNGYPNYSFARRSTRADGVRDDEMLFFRRSETDRPVDCYSVTAHRRASDIQARARVVARYGYWRENESQPRIRVERFGFLEWEDFPWSRDDTDILVSACRQLRKEEAEAIASYLESCGGEFEDVTLVKGYLREMDASEGMGVTSNQRFSQAGPLAEAKVGIPFFLSIFPDKGEDL